MTAPQRRWRSYGDDPLPSGPEALAKPFSAFPSWFLRVECERCGNVRLINQVHMGRDMPLHEILSRMRHDERGGRAGNVVLQAAGRRGLPVVLGAQRAGTSPAQLCLGPDRGGFERPQHQSLTLRGQTQIEIPVDNVRGGGCFFPPPSCFLHQIIGVVFLAHNRERSRGALQPRFDNYGTTGRIELRASRKLPNC
jgi:hypothetical protein